MTNPVPDPVSARRTRQRRTVTALAVALIVTGIVVVTLLHRLPLPIRIMAGLGDVFIGCVLLVLVRQDRQTPRS